MSPNELPSSPAVPAIPQIFSSIEQMGALRDLCARYKVAFDPANFHVRSDLPPGYVAGWIGDRIYVGCSPEGDISS